MAAALAACTGQTTVPTATVAPTVEEPTAAPAAETVEEKTDESASTEAETEAAATDEEKPAEETAVEETAEDTAAAEKSEEKPAEAEVNAEETAEATAETTEETAATAPTEETQAETEETTVTEETSSETTTVEESAKTEEAASDKKTDAETEETAVTEETSVETTAVEETAETTDSVSHEKAEAVPTAETAEPADADNQYAATVDGEGVSLEDFEQMAVFNRYQYLNQYAQYAQMYSMYGLPLDSLDEQVEGILGENGKERLGSEVIDQLTYDKVLKFEAEKEGLELSDEDVYNQLKTMFGYEEPAAEEEGPMGLPSFNVEPAATESESDKYADFQKYAESVLSQGYGGAVSFNFIKNYARNILLDNRMFEASLEDRVFEAEMVNARHILVEDEETAKDILARLEAGEEWDALASENSLDTANKDNSGSLGWFGRGEMVAEFEQAAFALEPGEISDPVQTSYGYHIIASDGKEVRPLSGAALQAAQSEAYDEWTLEMRAKHDIQSYPEVWLDAVPMEPAFVSLNPAPAADDATADAEAETVSTDGAEAVAAVAETVEEASAEAEAAEAAAAVAETVEEASAEKQLKKHLPKLKLLKPSPLLPKQLKKHLLKLKQPKPLPLLPKQSKKHLLKLKLLKPSPLSSMELTSPRMSSYRKLFSTAIRFFPLISSMSNMPVCSAFPWMRSTAITKTCWANPEKKNSAIKRLNSCTMPKCSISKLKKWASQSAQRMPKTA